MNHKFLKMVDVPEKLINLGEKIFLKKDQIIFHRGEKTDYFCILIKGKIIGINYTKDGLMFYSAVMLPNYIFCESCVINDEEVPITFKCLNNVELVKISKNTLLELYNTDIDIFNYIYRIASEKFYNLVLKNSEYLVLSSEQKIVEILLELVEEFGIVDDGKIKINFKFSQELISDLVGVNRRTTTRTFTKLRNNNILEYIDGDYYINNIDLLKQFLP